MIDLREEWTDLLARRPEFGTALASYGDILDQWARWAAGRSAPLAWARAECAERWARGVPLLAEAPPAIRADDLEELLGVVMERVVAVREDAAAGLQRLAEAWDRGEIGPAALFPAPGRVGARALEEVSGLPADLLSFLAGASLRPALGAYFSQCRQHLDEHAWEVGVCPFCGGPAAFSDVLEDGKRRLACHLCGGAWTFPRLRCPHCGTEASADLVRLEPEDRDQGYVIVACRRCNGYVKELDRRVRWNARSALVEDWGSPHLDVVAKRAGYWRALPTLLSLV
ncbi:MAG: formate dehydrogenase accessory protein FdhE [candidate division NC10 bacterium]